MNSLVSKIEILKSGKLSCDFTGIKFNEFPTYLAINKDNQFSVLLPCEKNSPRFRFSTDIVSLSLGVEGSLRMHDGQGIHGFFHIINCKSYDDDLIITFLTLCDALISSLDRTHGIHNELISFFNSLTQLFKITSASDIINERQGLWGELFVIRSTNRIPFFVEKWHNVTTRKFDFSTENYRLEVKTTISQERIHNFSHQQLFAPTTKQIVVASVMLRPDDIGLSLKQLINIVREEIRENPELLLKLEQSVRRASMNKSDENGPIYDEDYALENLAWYDSINIPKFMQEEPAGVSGTHYKVDLSTVQKMNNQQQKDWISKWQ